MISIDGLTVEFGGTTLFSDLNFQINEKDRIALMGKNGAGKSTLLKILAGVRQPTRGKVTAPKDCVIAYLPQHLMTEDGRTVFEEASQAFAHLKEMEEEIERMNNELATRTDYESDSYMALIEKVAAMSEKFYAIDMTHFEEDVEKALLGLGFLREDFNRPTSDFSGGWRMRIELAKLLLQNPDVLLLDEPTNHLDIESIQWLEDFLINSAKAVVVISHDRKFVDNITTRTIEVTMGRIYDYKVNYSQYLVLRKERREQQMKQYEEQQKMIQETKDFIERFKGTYSKTLQVQSRVKMLEKLELIEVDEEDTSALRLKFPPSPRSGNYPVIMEGVGKTYGDHVVFKNANLTIERGDKVAFVGKNGEGKSTLVKCIMNEIDHEGTLTLGHNVQIGYFAQNQASLLDENLTVFQTIDDVAKGEIRNKIRDLLGAFMFGSPEASMKKVKVLSGGERTRLAMIKLLLEPVNLLILDEPTNHLDMKTVEWLEDYLINYPKAVVMVSHDRAFLDAVATGVYELENGSLYRYAGNYTQYRQQKLKNLQIQRKAYERQQAEIAHNNELIEKFRHKPKKAAFARSRKTMLARMKLIEKPVEDEAHIFTGNIEPQFPSGKWVYEAKELRIGYDGRALLELSLRIKRGQKIAVLGDNGIGKSTFLKTVAGLIPPIKGTSQLGNNLLVRYFDQQSALIDSEKTVRDHFHELFPALVEKDLRKTLGMYLFGGANASKRISSLSGGEKSRLVLAELLTGRPNLMILDEPTNHMDIPAKETLESAFKAYTGTMLFVSHDRYFIKQVADAILVFEKDKVMYYPFGYDHYISRLKTSQDGNLPALMQAKDAAMVEALAAVPKRERHETRQLSTDEAYLEWKLTLAAEPMLKAAKEAEKAYEELCEAESELKAEELRINADTAKGNVDKLRQQYENATDSWTNECTKWYDIYLNEMYPETDF